MNKRKSSNQYHRRIFVILSLVFLIGCADTLSTFAQNQRPDGDNAGKALIGKWKSSEATIVFKSGNKITINGEVYGYAVIGSTIVVGSDEESVEFPFKLSGDVLTVWVDGRKVVYTRINGDDVDEETSDSRSNANRTGGNPQELVGKWCYQANVQASGGGRQSDICFTLEANGSYSYYGESSSSNIYGGTGSQSWDYGRWSATATTLTARSNKGETKTYSLEKRNHPKTGDPMLIVDGDAFVTFYQKQPW